MRERRWGDSGPSCSKTLTCGHRRTEPLRLGGEGKAASFGTVSKGPLSLHPWAFAEQGGDKEKLQEPPAPSTLSSIEDSRLVSWLSLVTMLRALASPGTWEMRKRAKDSHRVPATEKGSAECFLCFISFHPPNNPRSTIVIPLCR